jgi:hypothetical protein
MMLDEQSKQFRRRARCEHHRTLSATADNIARRFVTAENLSKTSFRWCGWG